MISIEDRERERERDRVEECLPVDADRRQVEYRGGTAHDIQRYPHVTYSITELPDRVVHLHMPIILLCHTRAAG